MAKLISWCQRNKSYILMGIGIYITAWVVVLATLGIAVLLMSFCGLEEGSLR